MVPARDSDAAGCWAGVFSVGEGSLLFGSPRSEVAVLLEDGFCNRRFSCARYRCACLPAPVCVACCVFAYAKIRGAATQPVG